MLILLPNTFQGYLYWEHLMRYSIYKVSLSRTASAAILVNNFERLPSCINAEQRAGMHFIHYKRFSFLNSSQELNPLGAKVTDSPFHVIALELGLGT